MKTQSMAWYYYCYSPCEKIEKLYNLPKVMQLAYFQSILR